MFAERHDTIQLAIAREKALKALKAWKRQWTATLIESVNPEWKDLYDTLA